MTKVYQCKERAVEREDSEEMNSVRQEKGAERMVAAKGHVHGGVDTTGNQPQNTEQ